MLTHGSGTGAGCPEHANKTKLLKLSSYEEHESNYLRFLLNRVTKFYFAVHFHSFMMDRLTDELPEHWHTKSMEPKSFFSIQFHQEGLDLIFCAFSIFGWNVCLLAGNYSHNSLSYPSLLGLPFILKNFWVYYTEPENLDFSLACCISFFLREMRVHFF